MSSTKHPAKKGLFDDEPLEDGELKFNPDFAKKFEYNKRRELLDKAKEKYGERALLRGSDSEASESSEEEDEDDEGELINAQVEKKFLETIAMIRTNDPKLKETEGELFKDDDFEEDAGAV
jgi:protein KRI1